MIKIIKQGQKPREVRTTYKITCSKCGCEFECDKLDFMLDRGLKPEDLLYRITCPCCEHIIKLTSDEAEKLIIREDEIIKEIHGQNIFIDFIYKPEDLTGDPCQTCPNRDGPKDAFGNPVVGDSPCQWCPHYKWRVTWDSTNISLDNYTTNYIDYGDVSYAVCNDSNK